jgi:uncharacterized protein YggT (Ycf19 family)
MKARENVRGWIVLSLIGLLAATILVSFILLWIHPDRSKELHDLLALVFGPLVALVGAATGYYSWAILFCLVLEQAVTSASSNPGINSAC